MIRIYGRDLRAPSLIVLATVIFGILIAGAVRQMRPGVALWVDLTVGLTSVAGYINPLVAGLLAWQAGRRREALRARTIGARRSPVLVVVVHIAALFTLPAFAALAALGIVAIFAGCIGAYGSPVFPWLGAVATGTIALGVFGYAAGLVLPYSWWVSPLVLLSVFGGRIALTYNSSMPYWLVQSYPTTLNGSNPFVRYIYSTFDGQLVEYLSLTALFVSVAACIIGAPLLRTLLYSVPILALMAGGVLLVASQNGQVTTGYNARDYSCSRGYPVVCVHKAYVRAIPALQEIFAHYDARVAGTFLETAKLEHNVGGVGDAVSVGARDLFLEDLDTGYAQKALASYQQEYGGIESCRLGDSFAAHYAVDEWAMGNALPPIPALERTGFYTSSDTRRRAWLKSHAAQMRSCHLRAADLN